MKRICFAWMAVLFTVAANAQNPLSQQTQVEISLGVIRPALQSGQELKRAEALRSNGQSYYEAGNGNRRNVGMYPALSGFALTIAFYKSLKAVHGLMLGATVRNAQTGSQPGTGGYEEGYFFNFITAGVAAKYYPFSTANLFAKADFGLASVLTKNRFITDDGAQNFFHQFGIGSGGSLGIGYGFTPFRNRRKSLELQATYQQLTTRVEVNGLGDDNWRFNALSVSGTINF